MDLFELYRALRRHNPAMALYMYKDLKERALGRLAFDIDTDEDFHISFVDKQEETDQEVAFNSFAELRAEVFKRIPLESVVESRRSNVEKFLEEAIAYFDVLGPDMIRIAEMQGYEYSAYSWGNWEFGVQVTSPASHYKLFGQTYKITQEALARIAEDVECLPTPEESAQ